MNSFDSNQEAKAMEEQLSDNLNWSKLGIKWLELLESQFDKNLVELELNLTKLTKSNQEPELLLNGDKESSNLDSSYQKVPITNECNWPQLAQLSATFVQLSHKCLLLCDANTGLERELHQTRMQLKETADRNRLLEQKLKAKPETNSIHDLSLSSRSLNSSFTLNSKSIGKVMTNQSENQTKTSLIEDAQEICHLRRENIQLRRQISYVKSDLFGAQLAAKYLDKELSGRIQQIQLLGNEKLKVNDRNHLWAQIEAEVRLNRHKAVVRSCQARAAASMSLNQQQVNDCFRDFGHSLPESRQVLVEKQDKEPLGISITGGKEHGIPILVSEIRRHSPASRCGALYVGDAILKVNSIDLSDHTHEEAARILMNQSGNCLLECVFLPSESDNGASEDETDFKFGYRNYFELQEFDSNGNPVNEDSALNRITKKSETNLTETNDEDRMSSITDNHANATLKLFPGSAKPLFDNLLF